MKSLSFGGRVGRVWRAYERQLARRPVLTNAATTAAIWAAGELLSQTISGEKTVKKAQVLSSAAYGGAVIGPLGHVWYLWLDRACTARLAPGTIPFVAAKVALDAFAFGPVHVAGFFAYSELVAGGNLGTIARRLKQDFAPTFVAELAFWPGFQALNFLLVPPHHQLLAVNVASLAECTFLCWARGQDDWLAAAMDALNMSKAEPKPQRTTV
ncbi:unnamed protein product [Pedinophyceae sp. YPF-701]|nr:unnamed protein product [Pedinophyceae sp. YPF-701]